MPSALIRHVPTDTPMPTCASQVPVIGALNGHAIGGGLGLALVSLPAPPARLHACPPVRLPACPPARLRAGQSRSPSIPPRRGVPRTLAGAARRAEQVCDIRVGNARSKYGANFVRLGMHPGMACGAMVEPLACEIRVTGRDRAARRLGTAPEARRPRHATLGTPP